ncbi:rho GTPase-activating protein 30 isoform X2 [Tenrec ecaudatus]|uniref:rho GTPase-activating protein 30 isoform X2 n=1 Tax=Tenrec ecaudatus TaxID=94439 RepID=UPI003F59EBFF
MKSRQKGKKKGTSKERVFGCDLQEHLQHSGQEVPQVLRSCAEFVEEYGVVDGIYRLSGVSSNIQKLRQEFEAERKPDLRRDVYLQDIHCVSSLCKAYFRELPDPLLTYRLYDKFAEAVAVQMEPERLVKILEVLRELPVPNYRTLEFLMRHLVHMASFRTETNMHARNLAIVWAPNLLRSKDIEASGFNGTAAFMEVRVQSIVVEFILTHVEQLFGGAALSGGEGEGGWRSLSGVRASNSHEDSMPRSLPYHLPSILQAGDGPPQIRPYHTIIEFAEHKRKGSLKVRKWRSIFNLGRSGHETKRKLPRGGEDREDKCDKGTLRPAKSMDSLSAAPGASDEAEALIGTSSARPSQLLPESLENDSVEAAAEGEQELETEALGGTNSEPGTPRVGRSAARVGGTSRAERCAGVHISDPYNVNLPSHITSILNVPPNIISNVSLARLTRGLECPALQPRPSAASGPGPGPGPGPPDEKSEASPCPSPLADSGPADGAPALEDCLSQEVQDSFSFLEDSSSSEPEWVGAEEGEVAKTGANFSPGEEDPGMGYLEELLGAGPQVEEFSVEPPLDDLSLEEAQFVLAPSCCSLDFAGFRPEAEEESGEEVFLSAFDDLSPLLDPNPPTWDSLGAPEEEAAMGRQQVSGQAAGEQTGWEVGDEEAEPVSSLDLREEAEESLSVDGEPASPQPPRPEEMAPEGQFSPEGCDLCPCPPGLAGSVGMRLASTLVQVQQVRSVPVVPPKPQFAKVPSPLCSKIHVAPANPCPRPGRLDGNPGERAWGSRASRSSWRNGGSLSFDAAVALARERQRTEAQGVRRTQTCTGGGDYGLNPRTTPHCSLTPAHSLRPLSCLERPSEGTDGSGPRSRLSLPPKEVQPLDPLMHPQRRSYAFETQANQGKREEPIGARAFCKGDQSAVLNL